MSGTIFLRKISDNKTIGFERLSEFELSYWIFFIYFYFNAFSSATMS